MTKQNKAQRTEEIGGLQGHRVSPSKALPGDIIHFERHLGSKEGEKLETHIGLIVQIHEKDQQIIGFDVFPLTEHDKDKFIKNDETHYMINRVTDIDDMGLNQKKNYRLNYKGHAVPNLGDFLNKDGKGGIVRFGSLHSSALFGLIIKHARNSQKNYGTFLGSSVEMQVLGERNADTTLQRIMESHSTERGTILEKELERQDLQNGLTRVISKQQKPATTEHKIRKHRRHKHDGEGTVFDIALNDAVKKGLITQDTKSVLETEFDKRRKGPLKTLGEAFKLTNENTKALSLLAQVTNANAQELKQAVASAHAHFLADISSPDTAKNYNDVGTRFNEKYEPIV